MTNVRRHLLSGEQCSREGCNRIAAKGDPFCSRRCVELVTGVRTPEEDHRLKLAHRRAMNDDRGPIDLTNPLVPARSADAHLGHPRKTRKNQRRRVGS